jgi:hypothetical protein
MTANLLAFLFAITCVGAVVQAQGSATHGAAKPGAAYTPSRTVWGDPNLQGTYTDKDEFGTPMERPKEFEGRRLDDVTQAELAALVKARREQANKTAAGIGGSAENDTGAGPPHWYEHLNPKSSRAWMVVDPPDGHIPPLVPGARPARPFGLELTDSYEERTLYDRCITRGLTGSMLPVIYGNSFQFVQGPGWVAIREEMIHEARVIPLDGRPHASPKIRSYMGDARGHWDGTTLVVETTNFTDRTAVGINGNGNPHSEQLRLTERFKPLDARTLEWSVTVDDPKTWTRPWTFAVNLTKDPTQEVFEYACHEGNFGLQNILAAARAGERKK